MERRRRPWHLKDAASTVCTKPWVLRRAISASYRRLSKQPVHANKGKSVSTDKMGKTDRCYCDWILSENLKERYSSSIKFGRGPQALGMTSPLDARGHYGWLHPWTPQREGDQGARGSAVPCGYYYSEAGVASVYRTLHERHFLNGFLPDVYTLVHAKLT